MTIEHGVPASPFFAICQPPSVPVPGYGDEKPMFELSDPKTGIKTTAQLHGVARLSLGELEAANSMCLLMYGIESAKLVKVLLQRYPEIEQTQKVNILYLKRL